MKETLDYTNPHKSGVPNRWAWVAVAAAILLVGAGVILPKLL
jgi:hypothetical protein